MKPAEGACCVPQPELKDCRGKNAAWRVIARPTSEWQAEQADKRSGYENHRAYYRELHPIKSSLNRKR